MIRILFILGLVAWLPSCCPTLPPDSAHNPQPNFEPVMDVVMVHGFLERGNNFKMLRERLEKKQVACHVVRLKPSDARHGICELADSLQQQIDETLGAEKKFSMVGFSMGGLVSRYYLQNLDGANRCDQLITIASPHHGTVLANVCPGKGARQMERGSDFLKQLAETEDRLGDMPLTSYRTPLDLVILPTSSSIWERADNRRHYALLHPFMLNIPSVLKDIEKRLLSVQ